MMAAYEFLISVIDTQTEQTKTNPQGGCAAAVEGKGSDDIREINSFRVFNLQW